MTGSAVFDKGSFVHLTLSQYFYKKIPFCSEMTILKSVLESR